MALAFARRDPGEACCRGIGVTGGAFRGLAAFNEEEVLRLRGALDPDAEDVDGVLLVLENPVPDEIPLILSVDALLASRGGSTAHAAVAVNGIDDKPFSAVLGVSRLKVRDGYAEMLGPDGQPRCTIRPGDIVSIHGQTGGWEIVDENLAYLDTVYGGVQELFDEDVSDFEMKPIIAERLSAFHDWAGLDDELLAVPARVIVDGGQQQR